MGFVCTAGRFCTETFRSYIYIYIQQFLDYHAADFTEEYLEQLTVQVKQKIKILVLLWSCFSSEKRTTDGRDLVRNFFEVNHFIDLGMNWRLLRNYAGGV
jgi:uncharacterized BrkB/YihY/UPF0761 family membrane protein